MHAFSRIPGVALVSAFALVLVLAAGAGCSAYDRRFAFQPAPASYQYPAADMPPAEALVSVIGVRFADKKAGTPAGIEVRVRLDNPGEAPLAFDPHAMTLYAGDLARFGDPIVEHPAAPGAAGVPGVSDPGTATQPVDDGEHVTVLFPFPPGHDADNTDLDGLNFRWTVRLAGQNITRNAAFTRRWLPDYTYFAYHAPFRSFYYDGWYAGSYASNAFDYPYFAHAYPQSRLHYYPYLR